MVVAYVILIIVGALTGSLGGMLGIGGSIIMLPAMVWVFGARSGGHEQIHQYMAAAMIVNFLLSMPSAAAHWRKKAIWPRLVGLLMTGGLLGVIVGVEISRLFSGDAARYLRWGLGVLFIGVALDAFHKVLWPPTAEGLPQADVDRRPWWPKFSIGSLVGCFAGITGLGGGVLAVPAQQYLLRVPIKNAIANSSALIFSVAWLGAISKNIQLGTAGQGSVAVSLTLAACLAPPAMIGSYIGGHLTHALPTKTVRLAFAVLIAASTWKLFAD